jgi:hypothetical protein
MSIAPRPLTRAWTLAVVLTLMLGLMPLPGGTTSAQDTRTTVLDGSIWDLIPGNATGLIAVNTDTSSEQWRMATDLVGNAGLTQVLTGLFDQVIADAGISPANFDPAQSSILGGTIAVAAWGDANDPFGSVAVYVDAADPERAYRSIAAQFLTENDPDAIEVEIPGGRLTTDRYGSGAIMLLDGVVVVTEADVAQVIANLVTGAGPTLADFKPFTQVIDAQSGDQLIRAYANGPAATWAFAGGFSPYPGYGGLGYQELALFGALAAPVTGTYTSVGISATDGGFLISSAQLPAPVIGPELPKGRPSDGLVSEVSSTADLFVSGRNLGQNSRFSQIIDMIVISAATSSGAYPDQRTIDLRGWAYDEIERRTGIDLRADLLDQINGDYVMAGALDSVDQLSDVNVVVRTDLDDAETVADTVGKLATLLRVATSDLADGADQLELTESRVGEDTLYTLAAREGGSTVTYSFGVVDSQLLAAMGDGMSLLTESDSGSLADDASYQDAIAKLPEQDGAPFYLDLHDLVTVAGLTFIDAPADWGLPAGQQIPLGGLQSIAGMTYAKGGLARTDLFLSLSGNVPGPIGTPSSGGSWAPYPGPSNIAIADATAIDVGGRRIHSVAPDGKHAVVRGEGKGETCVVALDGSSAETCTDEIAGIDVKHIAWSPDGTLVAVTENAAQYGVDSDIWIIDAGSGDVRNLTDDDYTGAMPLDIGRADVPDPLQVDVSPIFTPDGAAVVFARSNWGTAEMPDTDLYRVSIDGGEPERITPFGNELFTAWYGAIWVEDSTLLISYGSGDRDEPKNGLWTVDVDSGHLEQLWHGKEQQYVVSPVAQRPDGSVVVVFPISLSQDPISSDVCSAAVLDFQSGDAVPIRDGNGECARLLGVSPDGALAIVSGGLDHGVWTVNLDSFEATRFDIEPIRSAVGADDTIVIAGAETQPISWTSEGTLTIVVNLNEVVRVTLTAGA